MLKYLKISGWIFLLTTITLPCALFLVDIFWWIIFGKVLVVFSAAQVIVGFIWTAIGCEIFFQLTTSIDEEYYDL